MAKKMTPAQEATLEDIFKGGDLPPQARILATRMGFDKNIVICHRIVTTPVCPEEIQAYRIFPNGQRVRV